MPDNVAEWVAFTEAKLDRLRRGNLLTQEQLRRSCEQIAISEELLKVPVPNVSPWGPPKERALSAVEMPS